MKDGASARRGFRKPGALIRIVSRDYWFKPLENHQINWCLVDDDPAAGGSIAYFFHECSGVFDRLTFVSRAAAVSQLRFNGFHRLAEQPDLDQGGVPGPPFQEDQHWNGPIYSSGRFWRLATDVRST